MTTCLLAIEQHADADATDFNCCMLEQAASVDGPWQHTPLAGRGVLKALTCKARTVRPHQQSKQISSSNFCVIRDDKVMKRSAFINLDMAPMCNPCHFSSTIVSSSFEGKA